MGGHDDDRARPPDADDSRWPGRVRAIGARTGEGRKRALAAGVKFGRKPKLTAHQKREASAGATRRSSTSAGATTSVTARFRDCRIDLPRPLHPSKRWAKCTKPEMILSKSPPWSLPSPQRCPEYVGRHGRMKLKGLVAGVAPQPVPQPATASWPRAGPHHRFAMYRAGCR